MKNIPNLLGKLLLICFLILNVVWFVSEFDYPGTAKILLWVCPFIFVVAVLSLSHAGVEVADKPSAQRKYRSVNQVILYFLLLFCVLSFIEFTTTLTFVCSNDRVLIGIAKNYGFVFAINDSHYDSYVEWTYEHTDGLNVHGSNKFAEGWKYGLHYDKPNLYLRLYFTPGFAYIFCVYFFLLRRVNFKNKKHD